MIYVLLADGFEELEALAPVDLLRRAGLTVQTVAVGDTLLVCGSHHIPVRADITVRDITTDGLEAVILPGGMPGTKNLEKSAAVQTLLDYAAENGLWIGAICAAPSILGHKGLLAGKCAICYPGYEQELHGALLPAEGTTVVTDGRFITAKGAGVSTAFGLALVQAFTSAEAANALRKGLQCG